MKRNKKHTNWSQRNFKLKNFTKSLPNLSKKKSRGKFPDKACCWTALITKISRMICSIQKTLLIWKWRETAMNLMLAQILTNRLQRNSQSKTNNKRKFTMIWLLRSTMTKTTSLPWEQPIRIQFKLRSLTLRIKWTFSKMNLRTWWKRILTKDLKHQITSVYRRPSKFKDITKLSKHILTRSNTRWGSSPNCLISQFTRKR